MSEIKRVTLTDEPDDETASSTKNVSASKSIRFDFKLFEPTADSFPEFNYSKLLHAEKRKQKKIVKKVNGFADPFEENDDDVGRIAKEFERKYGTTCASKKKRSNNNYCDKGAGYDENDDFIDNTEAYDELIPDEIETVRGGFYINSGALEFKNLPNFERPEDAARMPKAKKRSLSSSDESSSSDNDESSKRQNSTKNGPAEKKPKLSDKDKHKNKEKKIRTKEKKDDGVGGSDSEKDAKKVVKTTTVKDMLRAKRDSMRNMIDSGSKSEQTEDSNKETSSSEDSSDSSAEASDGIDKKESNSVPNGDVKLPENLPAELLANIKKITEASKVSSSGKNNFFDSNNMNLLFEIDTAARVKGGVVRNQIFTYLEKYLPCTKQTILVRAKKIRSQKEEAKTNKFVKKLKMAVGNIMPDLLTNYDTECKRVSELKVANAAMLNGGKEQPIKNPKKKFVWTDALRHILCEVITSRKQSYTVIKPRRETLEDFVKQYLNDNVLKIWPDGWMKLEDLQKEYDKRQITTLKKPKENKKPIDTASHEPPLDLKQQIVEATTNTSNNPTINNNVNDKNKNVINQSLVKPNLITEVKPNEVKSILSSNNSIVPKLKETSVTVIPSGKSDENKICSSGDALKTATSPTPSFGSNLTITPIGVNDKMTSKPLASVQNQVTITNVDSSSQSKVVVTTPAITQHSNKASIKDPPAVKTTSSTTSSSSNAGHSINQTTTKLSTKTPPLPADLLSPPKKATDHSINSIISSTAPINSHSKSENSKSIDLTAVTAGTTTRVINLDNLTKNDILSTAAAQTTSGDANIRIKSVENLNSSVDKNATTVTTKALNSTKEKDITSKKSLSLGVSIQKPSSSSAVDTVTKSIASSTIASKGNVVNQKTNFSNPKPKAVAPHSALSNPLKSISDKVAPVSLSIDVEELSSDSDEVEFVSETQLKKVKNSMPVFKQCKKSNSSSGSNSPSSHAQSSKPNIPSGRRRDSSLDGNNDLDVKQIMEAIKELQEMQTNATGVHSSGSNATHNKKSLHHSSSLPYNKKLDHLEHTASQLSKSSS